MSNAKAAVGYPGQVAPLLSFVAGNVDTTGFVALFGLFTAHVTGNFVVLGASLVHANGGVLGKLLALPAFVLGVALTALFVRRCERSQRGALKPVLLAQIVLLGGFAAIGMWIHPVVDPDAPAAILAGLLGVVAMANQNAASRMLFTTLAPTTVMTGNVTQVVIDAVDLLRGVDTDARAATRARFSRMWPSVVSFGVGAVAAALLFLRAGFASLAVPMGVVAIVVWLTRPHLRSV